MRLPTPSLPVARACSRGIDRSAVLTPSECCPGGTCIGACLPIVGCVGVCLPIAL